MRGERGAKDRLGAPLVGRRGVSSPSREEPAARPSEAVSQVCGAGRSAQFAPNPVFVAGRNAGRTPSIESRSSRRLSGEQGSTLRIASRCGKRFVPWRTVLRGSKAQPVRSVRRGRPFGEQGSTLCGRSRAQRRSPQVSRREILESLTLSPLLTDRPRKWKGFGAPGLKVFTFHCVWPQADVIVRAVLELGAVWQPALVFGLPRIADTNSQLSRWEEIPCLVSEMPYRTP